MLPGLCTASLCIVGRCHLEVGGSIRYARVPFPDQPLVTKNVRAVSGSIDRGQSSVSIILAFDVIESD